VITQAELKELLDYDPATGIFVWNKKYCDKTIVGKNAGSLHKSTGYIYIKLPQGKFLAHRLAWLFVYGEFPEFQTDHINGIRNDNRINNLREANHSQNAQNAKSSRLNNKSGFLGVSWLERDKCFRAAITIDKKPFVIGYFSSAERAHDAYLKAKRELHPFNTL
jgi:hypothetical protein